MKIGLVVNGVVPAPLYGGTERVVAWLARALVELGHEVHLLARPGSACAATSVRVLDGGQPVEAQLPSGLDIIHLHSDLPLPQSTPFCLTMHGNQRDPGVLHPNTIFVSRDHAARHRAVAFVDSGLDPRDYGPPRLDAAGDRFCFLAKAAWKVKNVSGAIRVARLAGAPIDILGGTRLNFSMGFRLTLDRHARFHRMVGGERKNEFLARARGLIFPVRWHEPAGLALMEAAWFGLPIFGTPYGSLPDYVPPHVGFLSCSASELAEAARDVARFDRRAIHAWCRERFTSERMARDYLRMYQRVRSGESLNPGPVHAPATRSHTLLEWRP